MSAPRATGASGLALPPSGRSDPLPAIHLKGLTKRFDGFTAVDGIDLVVERGDIFGFLGPNGAGKTTTIRMLLGLLVPSSGTADVLGYDVRTHPAEVRKRIGYMSQRFGLYRDLTVRENLAFYGRAYGVPRERLASRIAEVVAGTDLTGREDQPARGLPGGYRQRLGLACAILHEPELLFLDEPTAGVDPISRRAFWDYLYELADRRRTVFVTTHYMDEAESCRHVGLLYDGRLVELGTPSEIKDGMRDKVLEIDCDRADEALQLILDAASTDRLPLSEAALYGARIHAVAADADALRPRIEALLAEQGIAWRSIDVIPPALEDVFIASVRAAGAGGGAGPASVAFADAGTPAAVGAAEGSPRSRGELL